ncbi:MAG: hypothetical protein JW788_06100 [Candidatus Omnitrophica bacterium]|nr:hypothetical protein [Candidatus Omnitrophota bacterium]
MDKIKKAFLSAIFILVCLVLSFSSPEGTFAADDDEAMDFAAAFAKEKEVDAQPQVPVEQEEPLLVREPAPVEKEAALKKAEVVDTALREIAIEIALEYAFLNESEQTFEIIDSNEKLISKLTYPAKGELFILKAEVEFPFKVLVGGRFASSEFKKKTCSDEDWQLYDISWPYGTDSYIDYQVTKQDSDSKVEFFDLNVYLRLVDFNRQQAKEKCLSSIFVWGEQIWDYVELERLFFDISGGYQVQKGRYSMVDPIREWQLEDEGAGYYVAGLPAEFGMESFYKIEYKGPRLGFRVGTQGRLSSRFGFSYTLLRTKAYGWWNLRDYTFNQSGKNGYGLDFSFETTYKFTPRIYAGVGYNYLQFRQKKMKESGAQPGYIYEDLDIVRNTDSNVYGPSFILKYIW